MRNNTILLLQTFFSIPVSCGCIQDWHLQIHQISFNLASLLCHCNILYFISNHENSICTISREMSKLHSVVKYCSYTYDKPCQTEHLCSHVPGGLYFHIEYWWHLLCPCPSCIQVWVSSVTEIRLEDLRAQDMDTPPEELHFMVTPPSNGHLALKSAPMKAVLNFTQAHIDQGQLLFVHKGKVSFFLSLNINTKYWRRLERKDTFTMCNRIFVSVSSLKIPCGHF